MPSSFVPERPAAGRVIGIAEGFIRHVRALRVPGRPLSELASLLARIRRVNQQLVYSNERISVVAHTDARVEHLESGRASGRSRLARSWP